MDQTSRNSERVYTLGITSKLSAISLHSIQQYIDDSLIIPHTATSKRHLFSKVDKL